VIVLDERKSKTAKVPNVGRGNSAKNSVMKDIKRKRGGEPGVRSPGWGRLRDCGQGQKGARKETANSRAARFNDFRQTGRISGAAIATV